MINVTFQFDTLQDLYEFTARQMKPMPFVQSDTPADQPAAPAEAPGTKARKPKAAPAVEAPAEAPSVPALAEPVPDIEAVRAAIVAVNDKFGLVPARRVLKKFSVARVTELKPEQYADFIKACGEVK